MKIAGKLEMLDPSRIDLNPHNPRKAAADPDAQAAFEKSVAEQGVLEPVLVRPVPAAGQFGGRAPYELVAGERRLKATLKAVQGKHLPPAYRIPAVVKPLDNRQALIVALTENLARADMHPLDESEAFAKLADNGVGTAEIAAAVNRTQRLVQQRIKVAKDLPAEGKEAMRVPRKLDSYARKGELWTLSFSQAFAIASVADATIKARTLRDVLKDYAPDRCNEDWIKRHAEAIERSRQRGAAKKKKGSAAAAMRPAAAPAFKYPTPDKDGVYKWPKRLAYPFGQERREEDLEVVRLRTCALAIRAEAGPDAKTYGDRHSYIGAYGVQLGTFPEVAEPLSEKHGTGRQWDQLRAAHDRAIAMMLKEFAPADAKIARALLRDLAKLIDRVDDPKAEDALRAKLDAKTEAMFPVLTAAATAAPKPKEAKPDDPLAVPGFEKPKTDSPAPRGAGAGGEGDGLEIPKFLDRRADQPVAAPDQSAPLTQKLDLPADLKAPKGVSLAPDQMIVSLTGLSIVGLDTPTAKSPRAKAFDLPAQIVVTKGERNFVYRFAGEALTDETAAQAAE